LREHENEHERTERAKKMNMLIQRFKCRSDFTYCMQDVGKKFGQNVRLCSVQSGVLISGSGQYNLSGISVCMVPLLPAFSVFCKNKYNKFNRGGGWVGRRGNKRSKVPYIISLRPVVHQWA
jgi:hypothetical protein